jgi:hypothetical protein
MTHTSRHQALILGGVDKTRYTEFWLKPTYAGGVRGKQQANAKLNLVEIKAAIGQLVYFTCDRVRSVNFKLIS